MLADTLTGKDMHADSPKGSQTHTHTYPILKIVLILITANPCVTFWHLNAIKICMWKGNQVKIYST